MDGQSHICNTCKIILPNLQFKEMKFHLIYVHGSEISDHYSEHVSECPICKSVINYYSHLKLENTIYHEFKLFDLTSYNNDQCYIEC